MLTPLTTRGEEDNGKTSVEYYYPPAHHHYYCQIPFNHESNNFHHPSIYETNQYYSLLPSYSHSSHHRNEENVNNQVTNTGYAPAYHSPESQPNEMFYPQIPSDRQMTTMYDYNVSPNSAVSSNPMFQQNSNYVQPTIEQAHCSTSNSTSYLTSFVS
jgi:hypothetical protein